MTEINKALPMTPEQQKLLKPQIENQLIGASKRGNLPIDKVKQNIIHGLGIVKKELRNTPKRTATKSKGADKER